MYKEAQCELFASFKVVSKSARLGPKDQSDYMLENDF